MSLTPSPDPCYADLVSAYAHEHAQMSKMVYHHSRFTLRLVNYKIGFSPYWNLSHHDKDYLNQFEAYIIMEHKESGQVSVAWFHNKCIAKSAYQMTIQNTLRLDNQTYSSKRN